MAVVHDRFLRQKLTHKLGNKFELLLWYPATPQVFLQPFWSTRSVVIDHTVKPVYNDHLMGYFSAFCGPFY